MRGQDVISGADSSGRYLAERVNTGKGEQEKTSVKEARSRDLRNLIKNQLSNLPMPVLVR
jgi:hypothetical protein